MAELPGGLLEAVKNYLQMTWPLSETETAVLMEDIKSGMAYLDDVAGMPEGETLDYMVEDAPRSLLKDYCRYARSHALEEFQINYQHELLRLQNREEVKRYLAAQEAADL